MANTRIKDISTAATTLNSDDFIAVDGSTAGTRKMAKADLISEVSSGVSGTYLEESNNLSDVASLDTSKLNMEIPDVGTAPNEVPLNGQLGSMAYQSAEGISVGQLEVTDKIEGSLGINGTPTKALEVKKTGFLGSSTLGSPTDSTVGIDVRGNASTDIIQGEVLGAYTLDAYDSSTATGGGVTQNSGMHFVAGNHFGPSASSVDLVFATGANGSTAERWRINASGNLVASSGLGIDFGSTSSGFGTPSGGLLNDYEEGTFTIGTAGDATGAISHQYGQYVKVGRVVTVRLTFRVSANFTGNRIDGLPFNAQCPNTGSLSGIGGGFVAMTSNVNASPIFAINTHGTDEISFMSGTSTGALHVINTTNSIYRITATYETTI
jgi:hypothetical protein